MPKKFQLTHSRGVRPGSSTRFFLPKISTHALTWSATQSNPCLYGTDFNFNSRTHVECDTLSFPETAASSNFNSRTHVECDTALQQHCIQELHFNSRTHVECDETGLLSTDEYENFNSRTHVECDESRPSKVFAAEISTHALTWSATPVRNLIEQHKSISTHALTWSATSALLWTEKKHYHFNSRTHVECDLHAAGRHCQHTGFQLTHSRGVRLFD